MQAHILQFLSDHWQAFAIGFGYALVAAISTMPPPGHPINLYEWFYDWTHALINSPGAARFKIPVAHPLPDSQPKS